MLLIVVGQRCSTRVQDLEKEDLGLATIMNLTTSLVIGPSYVFCNRSF